MAKVLTILEVSQKQAYVFGSKKLKENADRSAIISYVTSAKFFKAAAPELFDFEKNMVYSGGGHTVLEFESRSRAIDFCARVTEQALRQFPGIELFAAHVDYDEAKTPEDNLKNLTGQLERKKASRSTAFRSLDFGVEQLDSETLRAEALNKVPFENDKIKEKTSPPDGFAFPTSFEELSVQFGDLPKDNFICVVHADGNAMGKRVQAIYESQYGKSWESCKSSLYRFSESIQKDFEHAFSETVNRVINSLSLEQGNLPVRPVILAGDDVCFVTHGKIGLECANIFLQELGKIKNKEDGKTYAACAGVAIVHQKYPFHQAYELAEELCSSAKKYGASLSPDGKVSAMDWHIEFGQMKDSLSELRKDYETEDGNRLELRPVTVSTPAFSQEGVRTYRFFCGMSNAIDGKNDKIARSKLKNLRTALKQGETESSFYLHDNKITDILYKSFSAEFQEDNEQMKEFREMIINGKKLKKEAFRCLPGDNFKRSLYFDAIELSDHWYKLEVKEK